MASAYSLDAEPSATKDTKLLNGFSGVPRTSWLIATVWRGVATYQFLVGVYQT
jgi:hypothetical protein